MIMTYAEFNKLKGYIEAMSPQYGKDFNAMIEKMEQLLDEADADDYFGTEGWKHQVGME